MLKMYSSLSYLWPFLNPLEEFSKEAERINQIIHPFVQSGTRPAMLEFGSGGGRLLSHFTRNFETHGVDLSTDMIKQSKVLNPSTIHTVGDMRSIDLGKAFDVILIGDSIGYAVSEEDLISTIGNCAKHLQSGGVLILAPDWTAETFRGNNLWSCKVNTHSSEVSLVEYQWQPDNAPGEIHSLFVFMVSGKEDTMVDVDHHRFGLHSNSVWKAAIDSAQLVGHPVHFLNNESGLSSLAFICTLQESALDNT